MRTPVLAALLVGCVDPVPTTVGPGADRARVVGARLDVTPLVPGSDVTLTVVGINPQEIVRIALGTSQGSGPCVGAAGVLCLDVLSPTPVAETTADSQGVATVAVPLPATIPVGVTVHLQAVVIRGASGAAWESSNVVTRTTQTAPLIVGQMVPGDLTITEVMIDPAAVADADGEWFELLNTSGLDADLDGLRITDFVGDDVTLAGTLLLGAGERLLIGRSADPAANGGIDPDLVIPMSLANDFDEIHLMDGAVTVDAVAWDDGASFPDPSGASISLPGHADHLDNDAGVNWSTSTCAYGAGDAGTPGRANTDTDGLGCPTTITALRDPTHPDHPPTGTIHSVSSAVVTGTWGLGFTIQDPLASSFGGLHVYAPYGPTPAIGDVVTVTGTYEEYYGLTELTYPTVVVTGSGAVPAIDVDPCLVSTGGVLAEPLESMRVRLSGPTITDDNPDAPLDFNEFEVDGCLRVDDLMCAGCWPTQPPLGTSFSEVSGILDFRYGENKLQPTDPGDLIF